MNEQQAILVQRLKEKELSVDRFLKIGPDKAAFEPEFQNKPYSPVDLDSNNPCFCKHCNERQPHKRWGILGKDFLVLVDTDKKEMYDLLSKALPETLEVTSPRRGLPHKYYCVCGEQVPNKTLYLEGDVDEKGRPNGAGEIRANNEYLVAPGTEITFKDLATKEEKTGMYVISKNVPIARIEYPDFMATVKPYFGRNQSQTITPEEMANGVSAGMRHAKGIRYACHLIGKAKLDAETAFFEMQRWNQLNNPPMDERDLKRQVRDACRYIASENNIPIEQVIGCGGIKNPIFAELDGEAELTNSIIKVPTTGADQYLAQGYKTKKIYAESVVLERKIETTTENDDGTKESQQDRLIRYCMEETVEFFVDQHQTPFARIKEAYSLAQLAQLTQVPDNVPPLTKELKEEGKRESTCNYRGNTQIAQIPQPFKYRLINLPVRSKRFKNWLSYLMYQREEKGAGTEAVSAAVNVISGKCQCEGKSFKLYNRVAPGEDGNIYLDMADENWRAIKITKEGWEVVEQPPILFRRYKQQKALVIPLKPKSIEEAREFAARFFNHVNVKDTVDSKNNKLVLICTIICYLLPNIPHPVIIVYGPQGATKSYLFKLIRRTIDPSIVELLDLPHDKTEIIQQLDHNWLTFYDNLTYLSDEISNIFCRAATGAGFSKRELYSDDDDIIFDYKRCVGVNGINQVAKKGDLLDRGVLIELDKVNERKTEAEVDSNFEVDRAAILGGFLTILSDALKRYPDVKVTEYQRLADFHRYGCAITEAYGATSAEFSKAYENKVENQTDETLNNSVIGLAVMGFLTTHFKKNQETGKFLNEKWEGTPAELLDTITETAVILRIQTGSTSEWPKNPQVFSRKLNDLIPALNKKGYEIVSKKGTPRRIIITPSTQKDLTDYNSIFRFCKISPSETVICDSCKSPTAKITVKYEQDAEQHFCADCFEGRRKTAEAQGVKFVEGDA